MYFIKTIRVNQEYLSWDHDKRNEPYKSKFSLVRWLFWKRFDRILELSGKGDTVLDFGCGNGIFLPTLSKKYKNVVGYDPCSDMRFIKKMLEAYKIKNVELKTKFPAGKYDIIICADVLEHIKELDDVIIRLYGLLKEGGQLILSAPTENRFYRLCRGLGGLNEPKDHYHNAHGITLKLKRYLTFDKGTFLPFFWLPEFLNLFVITRFIKKKKMD